MEEEIADLKMVLRAIAVCNPSRLDVETLLKDYREMIGDDLPGAKFGYNSPLQFLKEIFKDCFLFDGDTLNPTLTLIVPDDIKHIKHLLSKQKPRPKNKVFGQRLGAFLPRKNLAYDLDALCREIASSSIVDRDSTSSCSHAVKEVEKQLKTLLKEHSDGICLNHLTTLYQQRYGRELRYQQWGDDLMDMMQKFSHIVRLEQCNDEWMLYNARSEASGCSDTFCFTSYFKQSIGLSIKHPLPKDCMQYIDSLKSNWRNVQEGDKLPVVVTAVYSPWEFWIRRAGTEHDQRLIELISDMTVYYSKGEGKDRCLPLESARLGQYCATFDNGYWYRAFIVEIDGALDETIVTVRHVDTGNVDSVPAASLKPMLKKWNVLPPQSMRARMTNVRPVVPDVPWPKTTSQAMLDLVQKRDIMAIILDVDNEMHFEVDLVDRTVIPHKHIRQQLVIDGHARLRCCFACNDKLRPETAPDSTSDLEVRSSPDTHSTK